MYDKALVINDECRIIGLIGVYLQDENYAALKFCNTLNVSVCMDKLAAGA